MNISKLFSILNDKKIVSYYILIILIGIVTGLLDYRNNQLDSIITILTDPENLNNIKFLDQIYSYLGFENEKDFFNFFVFLPFYQLF